MSVRVWPECGGLTARLFLLGVRHDRTPSKNGPESQGPRDGQMRTACSTSTVPGVASDRRSARATGVLTTCMHSQYPCVWLQSAEISWVEQNTHFFLISSSREEEVS